MEKIQRNYVKSIPVLMSSLVIIYMLLRADYHDFIASIFVGSLSLLDTFSGMIIVVLSLLSIFFAIFYFIKRKYLYMFICLIAATPSIFTILVLLAFSNSW